MFIVDESIEGNLELLLSPFYRDSVGGEEIDHALENNR